MSSGGRGGGEPQWHGPAGQWPQQPSTGQDPHSGDPGHSADPGHPWGEEGPPPQDGGGSGLSRAAIVAAAVIVVLGIAAVVVALAVVQPWRRPDVVSPAPAPTFTPAETRTEPETETASEPETETETEPETETASEPETEPEPAELTELVSVDGRFRVQFDEPGWIDTTTGETGELSEHPEILSARRTGLQDISIGGEDWEWGEVTQESVMSQTYKNGTPAEFILGDAPVITIAGNPTPGVSLETFFNVMHVYYLPPEDGVSPVVVIGGADQDEADHALALFDGKITRVD